jgi:hypothetical protein
MRLPIRVTLAITRCWLSKAKSGPSFSRGSHFGSAMPAGQRGMDATPENRPIEVVDAE